MEASPSCSASCRPARSGSWPRCRRNFTGWVKPPRVIDRPYHKHGRGRGRKTPRLASGSPPPRRVDEMLERDGSRGQPWRRWRIKDGHKGPMVWEVKHLRFTAVGADGLPGELLHLVVARDVLNPEVLKFFVSNAPEGTPVAAMLLVAFSRWRVERCFEDQKSEIGLDQYEGRRYQGLRRHLLVSCVSYLFLSRMRGEFGGGKSGADGVPGAHGVGGLDPVLVAGRTTLEEVAGSDGRRDRASETSERISEEEPHQANEAKTTRSGHQIDRDPPVYMGENLAL